VGKLRKIPIRDGSTEDGYDAYGITAIELVNDGSPVSLASAPPAPAANDDLHYDRMLNRLVRLYEDKYSATP
jgi:hypothetical protein